MWTSLPISLLWCFKSVQPIAIHESRYSHFAKKQLGDMPYIRGTVAKLMAKLTQCIIILEGGRGVYHRCTISDFQGSTYRIASQERMASASSMCVNPACLRLPLSLRDAFTAYMAADDSA